MLNNIMNSFMNNPVALLNNPMVKQMIINTTGIRPQDYNSVIEIIKDKNPQQLKEYAQNLAKNQQCDFESVKKEAIKTMKQMGIPM